MEFLALWICKVLVIAPGLFYFYTSPWLVWYLCAAVEVVETLWITAHLRSWLAPMHDPAARRALARAMLIKTLIWVVGSALVAWLIEPYVRQSVLLYWGYLSASALFDHVWFRFAKSRAMVPAELLVQDGPQPTPIEWTLQYVGRVAGSGLLAWAIATVIDDFVVQLLVYWGLLSIFDGLATRAEAKLWPHLVLPAPLSPLASDPPELNDTIVFRYGRLIARGDAPRIDQMLGEVLEKVAMDTTGWRTLYRHSANGSYWELDYPDSGREGGGPRRLRKLDVSDPRAWH
jgi:Immunity protein 27